MARFPGTEKDYAISKGLAKAGRGRMSLDAKKAVAEAKAQGMTFKPKGAPTATVRVAVSTKNTEGTSEPQTQDKEVSEYADAFYRYPADQEFMYEHNGKKFKISGKPACMNCGYSLIGHTCNDPVALTSPGAQKVSPVGK